MNNLYLYLDIGVILFPMLLSFDKKVAYYKDWTAVFVAMMGIGTLFLIHDYYFTKIEVWGFNESYLTGNYLLNLPIEEVLFFVVVPFACLFIYQCCKVYLAKINFTKFNQFFFVVIIGYAIWVTVLGYGKWYSTTVVLAAYLLVIFFWFEQKKYPFFPIAFSISMFPFFGMNSILTGSFLEQPIVWYNNNENIGVRWGTIPAEDILYSFVLIGLNVVLFDYWKLKK